MICIGVDLIGLYFLGSAYGYDVPTMCHSLTPIHLTTFKVDDLYISVLTSVAQKILSNKRPMGHISHALETQLQLMNTFAQSYHNG